MSYVNYHYTDDTNKLWRKPLAARYIAQNAHLTDLLFWAAKSVLCPGSAQTRWGAYSAGHTGIQGNERVDEAAKAALGSTVSTMKCPASDSTPEQASFLSHTRWLDFVTVAPETVFLRETISSDLEEEAAGSTDAGTLNAERLVTSGLAVCPTWSTDLCTLPSLMLHDMATEVVAWAEAVSSDSVKEAISSIVESGRLNGTDALLINCTLSNLTLVTAASHISVVVILLFWEDFALVTHVLLTDVYSLAITNHSVTNVNVLLQSSIFYWIAVVWRVSMKSTSRAARLKNYLRLLMQRKSWILSKKSTFIILFSIIVIFPIYISYWSFVFT